jgi:hypothetical protein
MVRGVNDPPLLYFKNGLAITEVPSELHVIEDTGEYIELIIYDEDDDDVNVIVTSYYGAQLEYSESAQNLTLMLLYDDDTLSEMSGNPDDIFIKLDDGLSATVYNIEIYVKPVNDLPILMAPNVTWNPVKSAYNFSVIYLDVEDDPPRYIDLKLDGAHINLVEAERGDTTYKDGKKYYYETPLTPGLHTYRFETADYTGMQIATEYFELAVEPPTIVRLFTHPGITGVTIKGEGKGTNWSVALHPVSVSDIVEPPPGNIGLFFKITVIGTTELQKLTVTIDYSTYDITKIVESTLKIYSKKTMTTVDEWMVVEEQQLDLANKCLYGNLPCQDGIYTVLGDIKLPLDLEPPRVIGKYPPPGAIEIPIDVTIKVTFNEHMLNATIKIIVKNTRGDIIPGIQKYYDARCEKIFEPLINLEYNTVYTVTVLAGAEDIAHNKLVSNVTWSFTTIAEKVEIEVEAPPKVHKPLAIKYRLSVSATIAVMIILAIGFCIAYRLREEKLATFRERRLSEERYRPLGIRRKPIVRVRRGR